MNAGCLHGGSAHSPTYPAWKVCSKVLHQGCYLWTGLWPGGSIPLPSSMKTCSKCRETKAHSEFNKAVSKKDGMQVYCRTCQTQSGREQIVKKQEYAKKLLQRSGCVDCGFDDWRILEFDHRPGTIRIKCVGTLICTLGTIQKLKDEIAKCDIVCPNCHALRTFERSGSWRLT